MLNFLPPDVHVQSSGQARRSTARPTYPDGRLIPQTGDEVYQAVQGAFGMPASLIGVVRGARVSITGGHALVGAVPVGKSFKLTPAWTVRNDPEILRRRAEEEAQRAAEAQAKLDRDARGEAAKVAAQAARGTLTMDQIQAGDLLEDDGGIRWWVAELNDEGEPYGIEEDHWPLGRGAGYLGNDFRGWRILERGMADPRPAEDSEEDDLEVVEGTPASSRLDWVPAIVLTVVTSGGAEHLQWRGRVDLAEDPTAFTQFIKSRVIPKYERERGGKVHGVRVSITGPPNENGDQRLHKIGYWNHVRGWDEPLNPHAYKPAKQNPKPPTVQQVARAIYQLELAVDEPERLTPAVLRVLRAVGWREGDPAHDPRADWDNRHFDAQMVVSDLSGPGFDLAGEMWR